MPIKIIITILFSLFCYISDAENTDKTQLLSLLHQADIFITAENYEKAAEARDKALEIFKHLGSNNDTTTISELHKISHAYYEKKLYNEATKTESILVEIFPLAMPDDWVNYVLYLSDLSLYQLNSDNTVSAEKSIKKALSLIVNANDVEIACVYMRAAEIYKETTPKRIDLSIVYQGKVVDLYDKAYGKKSSKYLEELWYLSTYLEEAEEYSSACNAYLEILHTRASDKDDNITNFLPILDRIIFCSRQTKNKELESHCKELAFSIAIGQQENHEPKYKSVEFPTLKDSIDYFTISAKMEIYKQELSRYEDNGDTKKHIEELCYQYLSTQPDTYGKAYYFTIETIRRSLMTNPQGVIEYGVEALRIYDKIGLITDKYVTVLCCVSEAYNELDNPSKAYEYILRAFELRDDYLSSNDIYFNGILNCLALYCSALGNYMDAIKYGTMAAHAQIPSIYTNSFSGYFTAFNNLATYYGQAGAYDEELKLLQFLVNKAEDIEPRILEYPGIPILFNLARSYYTNGDYIQSIETALKVKGIRTNYYRKDLIAHTDMVLACAYQRLGKSKEALNYAIHANDILKESGRDDDLALANSYDILAEIYSDMQEHEKAEEMARSSINLKYQNIIHNFVNLSSDDRTSYWNQYSSWFSESYPNYFFQSKIQDATELYNKSALFAKGILLNADTEMSKLILESGDYKALTKYQKILTNRSLLSKNNSNDNTDMKMSMDSLRMETDKLELELIQECKVYGDYTETMRTTWQDVQTALKPNDIAIEFLSFPYFGSTFNKTLYAALILRKDDTSPQFISLFDEAELDTISNDVYSDKLYELIWKPIEQYLSGVDNVYFSPSGKLYNINIEIIPEIVDKNNGKNYYRVSSTRLIAHPYHSSITHGHTIIYGGLDYNTSVSNLIADSKSYTNKEPQFRGNANDIELRSGWDYLPATLDEANSIGSTMRSYKIPTIIYTDTIGTEASFKSLDGQLNKIIHLATHGFYYSERDSTKMKKARIDYMLNQINIKSRSYIEDYSLTRSGLLLAGCNNILRGYNVPDDVEDGILFAKEIASMNLKNVDLVTLSSCDSGLGDITGEGVLGLQRAFKKAGVNTLLMSLNKVDDEATQILMVEFYKNLMSGKTKYQSLKDAQTHLRTIENGKYADPKCWASFIILDGLN